MKKTLLTLLLSCFAFVAARADLIYYEGFNYANGYIVTGSTNLWLRQSGANNDSLVNNHKLEVSTSSGVGVPPAPARTDDVNRPFAAAYTNSLTNICVSFTMNMSLLPSSNATYFAHFLNNNTTFFGRVFALTGNPGGASNNFAALPGTYRLGVSASAQSGSPNKTFPVDLATNTDYQVVIYYDATSLLAASIWVNPISSSDYNLTTTDAVTNQTKLGGFGFRQAGGFGGFLTVSNLAAATTFDEAATNVWATNAVAPTIVYQPKSGTNFVGDVTRLFVVANGQGLANLNYQWRKDGTPFSNPDGNVLNFSSAAVSDSGNYDVVVTTPYGLTATSASAFLWVTNPPVPPTISKQPSNTTVYAHQNASLKVVASGPPPLTYSWFYNNAPITSPNVSDDGAGTLTITDVTATNATVGTYRCDVGNTFGTVPSANAVVALTNPPIVSIAFLRSLVDTNYTATNSVPLYQATGTVTTFTNLTTGNTASYYIQDGTAGINIFTTFGQDFRPSIGDRVTFIGFLSTFNGTLELEADLVNNPATGPTVVASNFPLPAAKVIPFSITNNLPVTEGLEGSLVMLTNVYFGTNAGTTIPTNTAANATFVVVTNAAGETFNVGFSAVDLDTGGQTLPTFAWSVIGPLTQNITAAETNRTKGFQVTVSRFSDIVTTAPTAVAVASAHAASSSTLTWTAQPYSYSYSVLGAANVAGPYVPIATGLVFTNATGAYTDTSAGGAAKFYKVVSP